MFLRIQHQKKKRGKLQHSACCQSFVGCIIYIGHLEKSFKNGTIESRSQEGELNLAYKRIRSTAKYSRIINNGHHFLWPLKCALLHSIGYLNSTIILEQK